MKRRDFIKYLGMSAGAMWFFPRSASAGLAGKFRRGKNVPRTALQQVQQMGLTGGLRLILDPGDSLSYGGSGQTWTDRSGAGSHFLLGATGSTEASDPTFNGVSGGRSSAESFAFDGSNYFTLATANPTWVENLHKDNAKYAFALWVNVASVGSSQILFSTTDGSTTGISFGLSVAGNFYQNIYNAGVISTIGGASLNVPAGTVAGNWCFFGCLVDEAVGAAGAYRLFCNASYRDGVFDLVDATYTSPATGFASNVLHLGSSGTGNTRISAGSRMGIVAAWEGAQTPSAQGLRAFYNATRWRYGV